MDRYTLYILKYTKNWYTLEPVVSLVPGRKKRFAALSFMQMPQRASVFSENSWEFAS